MSSKNNKYKKKENGKNDTGRPTKLTKHFIDVAQKVIEENILLCTDEELIFLINKELTNSEKITDRTFQSWKSQHKNNENLSKVASSFFVLIKNALIKERNSLFTNLKDKKETQWQRWAWIIERKFDDWNIRLRSEIDFTSAGKELSALTSEAEKIVAEAIGSGSKK